jgi:hypothetical protein
MFPIPFSSSSFREYPLPRAAFPPPQRCGFSIAIPWTAALPPVIRTPPTARGTIVTGIKSTDVKEASTFRFTCAGLCDDRKRVEDELLVACSVI